MMWWNEDRMSAEFRRSAGGFLSWTFRGYEAFVLVVALGPVLDSLISPVVGSARPFYAGIALGVTLLGWAVGGAVGGFSDRLVGYRNTATYSVLGYALFMVLTALSGSFVVFIGFRFLTGVFLGTAGERTTVFRPGTDPDARHARNGGSIGAGFGVGIVLASVAWFIIQSTSPEFLAGVLGTEPWRYLFAFGVVPAVFVLALRRTASPVEGGDVRAETETDGGSARVEITGLFGRTSLRGRVAVGVGAVFAAVAGWWGVTAWLPLYATSIAIGSGLTNPGGWAAFAGVCYGIGMFAGYVTVEPLVDRIGRLGSVLAMFFGAFVAIEVIFLIIRTPYVLLAAVVVVGYFAGGGFGWLHVYLPELFPDVAREGGFETVFSLGRLFGAAVPVFVGYEIVVFNAVPSVLASVGVLYVVGIFAALYLPNGMERPFDEQG